MRGAHTIMGRTIMGGAISESNWSSSEGRAGISSLVSHTLKKLLLLLSYYRYINMSMER